MAYSKLSKYYHDEKIHKEGQSVRGFQEERLFLSCGARFLWGESRVSDKLLERGAGALENGRINLKNMDDL